MIDERDKCTSCNTQYIEHLGIIGTCARLQEAIALLKNVCETGDGDKAIEAFLLKVKK